MNIALVWAKLSRPDGSLAHPLVCHLIDVANVVRVLWSGSFGVHLKRFIAGSLALDEDTAGQWIAFWAGAHDLGKASPWFQAKCAPARDKLQASGFPFGRPPRKVPPHSIVTGLVLEHLLTAGGKHFPSLPSTLASGVATALSGHHGVFATANELNNCGPRVRGIGPWEALRRDLLEELAKALDLVQREVPHARQRPDHAFFLALAGLTSVADWLGSAEKYFPYAEEAVQLDAYFPLSQQRAQEAIADTGWLLRAPTTPFASFRKVFGFTPRPIQTWTENLQVDDEPALVLIEAPMGEGKTEAALYLADRWGRELGQEGFFVALPTQATSNQMFERVQEFLRTRHPGHTVQLQLLHASAALSDAYRELRLAAIGDGAGRDPSPNEATVVAEEWFSPKKRGLLSPFGVGTVDQTLLAVLQTRHQFVRLYGLAHKTVIVDEVHAYDVYMSTILERLLAWLRAMGTSVVLLSATLPADRRRALVEAYAPEAASADATPYPRITHVNHGSVHPVSVEARHRTAIDVHWVADQTEAIAMCLSKALADGGCAACILNTVGRAQNLYRALKRQLAAEGVDVDLLHARYPFDDRQTREQRTLDAFGRGSEGRPHKAVLVATQVIEQSLDVDFDLLVTDLAPLDLVLQRAGRMHRHGGRARPPALRTPNLWIVDPPEGGSSVPDLGVSGYVYSPYILLRSLLVLKEYSAVRVPEDVDALIELVYGDPGPSAPTYAWSAALAEARDELDRESAVAHSKAESGLIRSPDTPDDILQAFCRELDEDDPTVHESLRAMTRMADPGVQVVCLHEAGDRLALDPEGRRSVDLAPRPDQEAARALLGRSLKISHRGCVGELVAEEAPSGWQRSALLRHHRALVFRDGMRRLGNCLLRLDPELGLVIDMNPSPKEGGET